MTKDSNSFKKQSSITKNLILNALPDDEFERLLPHLEPVQFSLGQIVYKSEDEIKHVYFLNEAMVSVIATTGTGQTAEIGIIGREGMVGIDIVLGGDITLHDNIVQHSDSALRISKSIIIEEFNRSGVLQKLLLNFTRIFMIQVGQTALCNRLHTVEERLSRWLLLCCDRAETNNLQLTQEFLAMMLGTNRATVTISAIALQSAGYIKYTRGHISIVDAVGLKDFACECYEIVRKQYDVQPK